MDFLDIVMELRKRYRVQIPEEDYPHLASMAQHGDVSRAADEGHAAKQSRRVARSACDAMYDTIIIGAGMSGLAAGIRLAHFDQRVCILERHTTIGGLNSFYRLRRPRLRRRPARRHQLHAQGQPSAARWPGCCGNCGLRWDEFALAPAARLGDRLSRRRAAIQQRLRAARSRRSPRISPARRTTSSGWSASWSTTTIWTSDVLDRSARAGRRPRSISDPLLVEMLFCPLMFYGSAREHDMDFGQFCIMFRCDLPGRAWPGRWPACG